MPELQGLSIIGYILIVAEILGVVLALRVVMQPRSSQGTIAWFIALITLPVITVPLYAVFGRTRFKGYTEALREAAASVEERVREWLVNMNAMSAQPRPGLEVIEALTKKLTGLPFLGANRVELLVDGAETYDTMIRAIDSAQSYVLVQFYIVRDDAIGRRMRDALVEKARSGVRVFFLYDEIGCIKMPQSYLDVMSREAIEVSGFKTTKGRSNRFQINFRNHRKLLGVDGEVAFVGGAGITDQFDPPYHPERRWRDTFIEIKGPVVADWQQLFKETWDRCGPHRLALVMRSPPPVSNDQRGRVAVSSGPRRQENKRALVKRVRRAAHRAWFATAYFIPSWKIRRALRRAARHGIDVRLLLPGAHTDHPGARHAGRRFYGRLLRDGVRIFEYRSRFLHAKTALCDDWGSIGSSNLDRWNLRWNLDADQLVENGQFCEEVRHMFERDFEQSREYTYDEWRRRPWHRRLLEWFWGRVDLLIERIGSRHRFRH